MFLLLGPFLRLAVEKKSSHRRSTVQHTCRALPMEMFPQGPCFYKWLQWDRMATNLMVHNACPIRTCVTLFPRKEFVVDESSTMEYSTVEFYTSYHAC